MFLAMAAAMGCDLFDSASYVKFAEDDRLLLVNGTAHLSQLREMPCDCSVCSKTTPAELKSLEKEEREVALMRHNLYATAAEMRRVRQAIEEDRLLELAAIRARSHPTLLEALLLMLDHADQIEAEDPVGKTAAINYTGVEASKHPSLLRFRNRVMERYPYRRTQTLVLVPHMGDRPYSETTPAITELVDQHSPEEVIVVYVTPFGAVPWEYEHVYPAQQCIFPDLLDMNTLQAASEHLDRFVGSIEYERAFWFRRKNPIEELHERVMWRAGIEFVQSALGLSELFPEPLESRSYAKQRKINALFRYQWDTDISKALDIEEIETVISRKTGKIRYLQHKGKILFTLVPTTGLMTPTIEGGQLLLRAGINPEFKVIMDDDAVPFIQEGRSALAKFVLQASTVLRPGEEVLLLNRGGTLLGVGRAFLSGREMSCFKRGVAVVTRHSTQQQLPRVIGRVDDRGPS
jgi:7-cyano-7-deazaguanine tRNA-ribosyltransferase